MAAITYLVSMALMALFLLVIAAAVTVGRDWYDYTPTLTTDGKSALGKAAANETTWVVAFLAGALVIGGTATLYVSGDAYPASVVNTAGAVVAISLALSFVFYIFFGSYRAAKARGFQRAAAVMAASWVLGSAAIVAITVKLLS